MRDALAAAGIDGAATRRLCDDIPVLADRFDADVSGCSAYWREAAELLERLPPKATRDVRSARAAELVHAAARRLRMRFLDRHGEALYRALTADLGRYVRVAPLVYEAAERVPGLVPTRAAVARELERKQSEKEGIEIDQGLLLSRWFARPHVGAHLTLAMCVPKPGSIARLDEFARTRRLDLGKATVERRGRAAFVTLKNPSSLNAEDETTLDPFETAVDVALLDPESKICVLRGDAVPHPKYAGRRVFSSGINLTNLYWGSIPYLFYIERDLGLVNKMYRGLWRGDAPPDETLGHSIEKLWIAAVEEFAIGGGCQLLLAMDYVLAAENAFMTLPARKEGIIPGMANMRLPRLVGDRLARQAIMFERRIDCASPEGRLICDEIVDPDEMDGAIERVTSALTNSGVVSAAANRRAFRIVAEPMSQFCAYMSVYAREQAYCHASSALVANLERFWGAQNRKPQR
jgi:thioesterase DpgC